MMEYVTRLDIDTYAFSARDSDGGRRESAAPFFKVGVTSGEVVCFVAVVGLQSLHLKEVLDRRLNRGEVVNARNFRVQDFARFCADDRSAS